MKAYPFKFRPIYKELIWGGQKLRGFFGKDIPIGKKIGESWELADLPNDESIIANGELTGKTLRQALTKFPAQITGNAALCGLFPLLIKFIDAEDVLSIQVHPGEHMFNLTGNSNLKAECWYIISAEQGAVIYKGLKKGVTKEKFAQAISNGTVTELLVQIPVKAGECYLLPAGTVHSIGAGLLIAEIQTSSNTTYRIFDWNRVDLNGKPRPLHIQEALASIDFDRTETNLGASATGRLVNCKYFKVDKKQNHKDSSTSIRSGQMKTLIIIKGQGIIESPGAISVEFKAGDTLLIPAVYSGNIRFRTETEYLKVTI